MFNLRDIVQSIRDRFDAFQERLDFEFPAISRLKLSILLALSVPAFFVPRYFVAFALMVLVGLLSVLTSRFELGRFGLELATFSSVTMAMVFPPRVAAVLAFVYIVVQMFSGSTPGVYLTWVVPTYVLAAYIISSVNTPSIVLTGLYTTAGSQIFFSLMTFVMSRSMLPKYLQYAAFNLIFNFLMFQTFGSIVLSLMRA
ncbi:MAG: hypothetical protein J07AB43_12370 [Candidatus Nanosalina sp. J07AB43]|nr:MAG: hypothetical protein J07AB43_12370 [Candidatus Nanosalina sp. J07AB43]